MSLRYVPNGRKCRAECRRHEPCDTTVSLSQSPLDTTAQVLEHGPAEPAACTCFACTCFIMNRQHDAFESKSGDLPATCFAVTVHPPALVSFPNLLLAPPHVATCPQWTSSPVPLPDSVQWNNIIMDMVRGAQSNGLGLPKRFYHVAIDCPGYGRSPSDRQTVRSYPGAFLTAVVEALGRRSAAAICGSSQGACATFNAALECPKLALALAVCHPVGHAPERYSAIKQPTLLIFDTEDAGHPVSVGRQMRRHLPNNRYFEFTRSRCSEMLRDNGCFRGADAQGAV